MTITHHIVHHQQPTLYSCTSGALATLFSHFGVEKSPKDLHAALPTVHRADGQEWGTANNHIAAWCIAEGFDVDLYSTDFQILDRAWADLSPEQQLERMNAAREHRDVLSIGKEWSAYYMQGYIDFLEAGGTLHMPLYFTEELLNELLANSPILACTSLNVLYDTGRSASIEERDEPDDINGLTENHSIVIYGKDDSGYLISDPLHETAEYHVAPNHLIAALHAAQIECDTMLFQLHKRS